MILLDLRNAYTMITVKCSVCMEEIFPMVTVPCGHPICPDCVNGRSTCSFCGTALQDPYAIRVFLDELLPEQEDTSSNNDMMTYEPGQTWVLCLDDESLLDDFWAWWIDALPNDLCPPLMASEEDNQRSISVQLMNSLHRWWEDSFVTDFPCVIYESDDVLDDHFHVFLTIE